MSLNSILSVNNAGMNGLQNELDTLSHNIANVDTVGYQAMVNSYQELQHNNVATTTNGQTVTTNAGVNNNGLIDPRNGQLTQTGRQLDLAINGPAYFGVQNARGQIFLTRAGNFHRDATGALVTANGARVMVNAQVPVQQWPSDGLKITGAGQISVGQTVLGNLQLFEPNQPQSLVAAGDDLYQAPTGIRPAGSNSLVIQGALSASNVDLAGQMTEMLTTQRAYQMNARALSATDEMMETVNHFTD